MGYRPPWPADWQATTKMVLADEAQNLATAHLYCPDTADVRGGDRRGADAYTRGLASCAGAWSPAGS